MEESKERTDLLSKLTSARLAAPELGETWLIWLMGGCYDIIGRKWLDVADLKTLRTLLDWNMQYVNKIKKFL